MKIFNGQVNWLMSWTSVDNQFMKTFISAIENGTKLPLIVENMSFVFRTPSTMSGVDIEISDYLC